METPGTIPHEAKCTGWEWDISLLLPRLFEILHRHQLFEVMLVLSSRDFLRYFPNHSQQIAGNWEMMGWQHASACLGCSWEAVGKDEFYCLMSKWCHCLGASECNAINFCWLYQSWNYSTVFCCIPLFDFISASCTIRLTIWTMQCVTIYSKPSFFSSVMDGNNSGLNDISEEIQSFLTNLVMPFWKNDTLGYFYHLIYKSQICVRN